MRIRGFSQKIVISTGIFLLMVVLSALIRIWLLYSDSSAVIVMSYLFFIVSAAVFMWMNQKFHLKTGYSLLALVVLTLSYQLVFSLNVNLTYESDLRFYFNNAVNFVVNGFDKPLLYQATFPGTVTYPAFLWPFMKLFGPHHLVPVILNHIAMTTLSCLVFCFCRRTMSVLWSLGAGFLIVLHPFTIIYANTCNAELIFGVFIFSAFYAFLKSSEETVLRKQIVWIGLAALFCGISNFFRPLGIVMLVALLLQLLLFDNKKILKKASLFAVVIIIYCLIGAGNAALVKAATKYDPPQNGFGWNLYIGASVTGKWNQSDSDEFTRMIESSDSPSEVQTYFAKQGLSRYWAMGADSILHGLRKLSPWYASAYMAQETAMQDEHSNFYSSDSHETYQALIVLVDTPILLLALLSCLYILYSQLRGSSHAVLPLVFYLLGSFLVLMVIEIAPRYTVSYRSIFCIISIYGIHQFWTKYKARHAKKS